MSTSKPTAPRFTSQVVDVANLERGPEALAVRAAYERIFGAKPSDRGGWYHPADWGRTTYALSCLRTADRVVDIGAGAGQFANMLAESGKFGSVIALDRTKFRKYSELHDSIERVDGDIAKLEFDDDSFEVVTCMEVLEHIPTDVFVEGLKELRRICRGQLIMTVPFREPEPLSKGHVRRFEEQDIVDIFPDGRYTILDRPNRPWVLIEEHLDGSPFALRDDYSADGLRIKQLEAEIERLRARRALRFANWSGIQLRRIRRRVPFGPGKR